MTNKLTKELVETKLTEWTLSCKVQETLGLSSMDEALFKKELEAFEQKGLIIREGARRGLKFKLADGVKSSVIETSEPVSPSKPKEKKQKTESKIDARDIDAQVTIFPRHEHLDEVTKVSLTALLSFILAGSTESSRSLTIKRSGNKVIIKTYKDCYCLSEVTYTKETFSKLLQASNIVLDKQ